MNEFFRRHHPKKVLSFLLRTRTHEAPFARDSHFSTGSAQNNPAGASHPGGFLSGEAKRRKCQGNQALQQHPERRLSLASDGGAHQQTPGLFAFIEVWTKWREQGRSELTRQVETSDSSPLFLTNHPKWPEVVEAVVAEWRAMGKYGALAQAALTGFKRDGTFEEEVTQLYVRNPGQHRVWYEAQAAVILTDWDTLSGPQKLALFELMLDPEGEPVLRS